MSVKWGTSQNTLISKSLDEKGLENYLRKKTIDPTKYRKLLELLESNNVDIKISVIDKKSKKSIEKLKLDKKSASKFIPVVRTIERRNLGTHLIPQTDDLDRLFKLIELSKSSKSIDEKSLDVVHRQIAYYKQAGRILGYLDENNSLTTAGHQLTKLELKGKYQLTTKQFEISDCGWAWIYWSDGITLLDIDPNSASKFIIENVPGLSKNTANRRAQTLKNWYKHLIKYHYKSQ